MNQDSLWFGFLDIGEKSSPVACSPKITTGKTDTIYLYNLNRNAIIEYKREIVEPKLRDLKKDEAGVLKELKSAYNKAAAKFTPRTMKLNIPDKQPVNPPTEKAPGKEQEFENIDDDFEDDSFDDED